MASIYVDDTDNIKQCNLQVLSVSQNEMKIRFSTLYEFEIKNKQWYICQTENHNEAQIDIITMKGGKDIIHNISMNKLETLMNEKQQTMIAVYELPQAQHKVTQTITIDIPTTAIVETAYKLAVIPMKSIEAIKVKEVVNLYWDHPPLLYGNVKYKIILENINKTDTSQFLPYQIPYSYLPINIKISAICSIEDVTGLDSESEPSITKSIKITSKYIESRKDIEIIKYGTLSHFIQVKHMTNERFRIKLNLNKPCSNNTTVYELREKQSQNKLKSIMLKKDTSNEEFEVVYGSHTYSNPFKVAIYGALQYIGCLDVIINHI